MSSKKSINTNKLNFKNMANIDTSLTARKLIGVKEILFTPFVNGVKGSKTYSLGDIEADSTSVEQDDATKSETQSETKSEPIAENITLGKYIFSTTSCDVQKDLLVETMGFVYDETSKIAYAPASYTDVWGEFEIVFNNGDIIVCPKVKLDSKVSATTLKTGMVKATLSGSCYSGTVSVGLDKTIQTPFYIKYNLV